MENKPGKNTTEFYVTLLVQVLGILALTGIITPDASETLGQQGQVIIESVTRAGGAAMSAWSAVGYTKARGDAKKPLAPPES